MREGKAVMSAKDISEYLGISQSAAYDLFRAEGFPAFRVGAGRGRIVVTREGFNRWIAEQEARGVGA